MNSSSMNPLLCLEAMVAKTGGFQGESRMGQVPGEGAPRGSARRGRGGEGGRGLKDTAGPALSQSQGTDLCVSESDKAIFVFSVFPQVFEGSGGLCIEGHVGKRSKTSRGSLC